MTLAGFSWRHITELNLPTLPWPTSLFKTITRVLRKARCAACTISRATRKRNSVALSKEKSWTSPLTFGSPQFGKWTSVLLSAKKKNQIYVPVGFAHGFLALADTVQFFYKCSDFHDPKDEHGILWNDPDLNISWGIASPVVSDKDAKNQKLAEVPPEFLPRYRCK
jgi:dTDP-4-dehydrorhamnose 3,5-epimerase